MLRHKSLHPLSHQHHNGLALGVLIRRSLDYDASPANLQRQCARAVNRFEHELINHFELEEKFLFPAIERELGGHPLVAALLEQHRQLTSLAEALRTNASREGLDHFLELLRDHIRAEENILFEEVQDRLSETTMDSLGAEFRARAICLRLQP
jgi:hemerythrin-like domain-containing protein